MGVGKEAKAEGKPRVKGKKIVLLMTLGRWNLAGANCRRVPDGDAQVKRECGAEAKSVCRGAKGK